ncbi:hypothetical protein V2J09_009299 [Rumex salicifolius]
MQPDNLDGGFLQMPNYFSGRGGEMLDVAGGFYGYDLPVPIFDDFYGSSSADLLRRFDSASSGLTETEAAADEKTLAALRNHKEAEKRRRERINSHLDRLRALIPCTSKTDKATLLAMVVQRVRELNLQTSKLIKQGSGGGVVPSESDEFSVVHADHQSGAGEIVLRASVCCEDRSELLSELTEVVSSLRLKTLRAEMCSLGGRSRNVLIVSGDQRRGEECAASLRDALKAIVNRSRPADRLKRRRRFEPSSSSFN